MEVSTGCEVDTKQVKTRRRFSDAFRRQVVEETLGGGESVSVVARRHDLNTNLLFKWRRRYQRGEWGAASLSELLPIRCAAPQPDAPAADVGRLDIALAGGHRLSLEGQVDRAMLRTVLETLR